MYIIDSRRFLSSHSGTSSRSRPWSSRVTQTTGWSSRWMVSCRAAIALPTESTRKGMSSLTMAIRIRRRPASPPVDSMRMATSPLRRRAATSARNSAASRSASRESPCVSPGNALRVSALRMDSTSGWARRVWTVIGLIVLRE